MYNFFFLLANLYSWYLECIKEYYGYGNEKAKSALNILNNEQIKTIKDSLNKGGKHGK